MTPISMRLPATLDAALVIFWRDNGREDMLAGTVDEEVDVARGQS